MHSDDVDCGLATAVATWVRTVHDVVGVVVVVVVVVAPCLVAGVSWLVE